MSTIVHRANSRGEAEHGWLHSFHTFSFADYHNSERMQFGKLRVLNDDVVQPGRGFGTHPHDNMEIVSIPLSGTLKHEDSMGTTHVISAGEVQVMSAGTGITHSEFNASDDEEVNFLQIWVLPKTQGIEPRYEQRVFDSADRENRFQTLISPNGTDGSLTINQDAWFSMATVEQGESVNYSPNNVGNGIYLFVIDGEVEIAGERLGKRDAVGIQSKANVGTSAMQKAQILCIEVPMDE